VNLYKQATWAYALLSGYGVVIALTSVASPIIKCYQTSSALPEYYGFKIFLLVTYFAIVFRFLLGVAVYHGDETPSDNTKSSGDLLFGFAHFILIFTMSLTLENYTCAGKLSAYALLLMAVLMFDFVWFILAKITKSPLKDSDRLVYWTVINTVTVILAGFVYLLCINLMPRIYAEMLGIFVVFLVSILDITGIANKKEYFAKTIQKIAKPFCQE